MAQAELKRSSMVSVFVPYQYTEQYQQDQAQLKERQKAEKRGRASTMLTGGAGLLSSPAPSLARRVLLGS